VPRERRAEYVTAPFDLRDLGLNRVTEEFGSHQTLLYKPIGPEEPLGAICARLDETE
jgi:hypothetical protein